MPKEPRIRWGSRSPMRTVNFEGVKVAHCRVLGHTAVSCAKMAEPFEMPFGLWTRMAQGSMY